MHALPALRCRSGNGGQGEIVQAAAGRWVENYKYKPGGRQAKKLWLPVAQPADGADGADIVLVCDPAFESLMHLHQRKMYMGAKGGNGNPAIGSRGPQDAKAVRKAETRAMEIPVPPGTVVQKKNGGLLGELVRPGQRLLVAPGGRGGKGVLTQSRAAKVQERAK